MTYSIQIDADRTDGGTERQEFTHEGDGAETEAMLCRDAVDSCEGIIEGSARFVGITPIELLP